VFLPAGTYWVDAVYDVVATLAIEAGTSVSTPYATYTYSTSLPTTFPTPTNYNYERLNYYMLGSSR
jgi:hypothetical protein